MRVNLLAMEMLMKRIGLLLCVTVLTAVPSALGQDNHVTFTTTADVRDMPNVSFPAVETPSVEIMSAESTAFPPVVSPPVAPKVSTEEVPVSSQPRMLPTMPVPVLPASPVAAVPPETVPVSSQPRMLPAVSAPSPVPVMAMTTPAPPAPAPMQSAVPPVPVFAPSAPVMAQNAITLNHRLQLAPQVFERNLIDKLGSRFVPVRSVEAAPGFSRYSMPLRDGTAVELVIDHQRGGVAMTASPQMAASSLQIVQLLDTAEVPGGAVTRFVPVQQSNMPSARRVAGLVNQEMLRVAQAPQPAVQPVIPPLVPPGAAVNGAEPLAPGDPSLGRVIGNVNIDIIDAFGTIVITGNPDDVAVVQEMVRQMEILSLENEPIIELVQMRHADSLRVSQLVQQLYQQVYLQRRGIITIIPLVKPNTILLVGRQESIIAAKELIAKLDTPVIPNASFKIFFLKHAAAVDLQTQIQQSIQGPPRQGQQLAPVVGVIADVRTNALIVQASPRDLLEVEAMIRELDIPKGEIDPVIIKHFPLRNTMAADMITLLSNTLNIGVQQRGAPITTGQTDAAGNLISATVLYNVTFTADTRSNTLIVAAPPDTMTIIEQLIQRIDRLPSAESKIRVFTLANGDAFALTTTLTNLFAPGAANQVIPVRPGFEEGDSSLVGIRFQTDVRTNSIIAIGSEADLAIAEALLLRLDSENLNNRRVFTVKLLNMPVDELEPILTNRYNTERQLGLQNTQTYLPRSPLEQYQWETSIIAEPITNSLIITTSPRYEEEIRAIIAHLDERPNMVAIEVLIAEVEVKKSRDRGVEFGLQDSILFSSAVPGATSMGMFNAFPGFRGANNVGTQGGITGLIPNTAVGGFSLAASSESVSIFVRALETQSRTQVLGRPRLVTLHNRQATIVVGESVPYQSGQTIGTGGQASTATDFLDVGTTLQILPRVMPDGMIAMAVLVIRSSLIELTDIGGGIMAPHTRLTEATTQLNAMDGQTVVFAGLIGESKRSNNSSVPGLNKIPVLKHLLEYDSRTSDRSELLIVLTPRILRAQEDTNYRNQKEFERMQWCTADVVKLTGNPEIRRRSDIWTTNEVRHTYGAPVILQETQLPPVPMFPVVETR